MKKRARESDLSPEEVELLLWLNARLLEMAVKFGLVVVP